MSIQQVVPFIKKQGVGIVPFTISDLGVSSSNLLLWFDGDDETQATKNVSEEITSVTTKDATGYTLNVPSTVTKSHQYATLTPDRKAFTNGTISTETQTFSFSRLTHGGLIVVAVARKASNQNIGYIFDNGNASAPRVFSYLQDSNTRVFYNFGNGKVVTRTAAQNAEWHAYYWNYTGGGSEFKIDNFATADTVIETSNWGANNILAGLTLSARANTYQAPLGDGGIAQFFVLKGSTPTSEIDALNTFVQNNYSSVLGVNTE